MAHPKVQAPLTNPIIIAISRLVDDAQTQTREPSHSDLDYEIGKADLKLADPIAQGYSVGKAKRLRATLSWALENDEGKGAALVMRILSHLRGCGGFRETSPNYAGKDAILDAINAFHNAGFELTLDGELRPVLLDNLAGHELTAALEAYVGRAKRGMEDAALVTGTGKDLLEATAAHVITEKWGSYQTTLNFPTLLGQAFVALGLATPENPIQEGEMAHRRLERALYDAACAVNNLRNKEGTGHGRPWLPTVSSSQARLAVEEMGLIVEYMLAVLQGDG
jgi:hypothetical protein